MLWALLVGVVALILWLIKLNEDYCVMAFFAKRVKTIDGRPLKDIVPIPKGNTIFGNAFDVFGLDSVDLFALARKTAANLKKSYVQYGLNMTFYNIITAEDAEIVLTDSNLITKGIAYVFLEPFIRTGLLTASNKKWHVRRKMLTPAFHFNILDQFEDIFKLVSLAKVDGFEHEYTKEESQKFINNLRVPSGEICVVSLSELIPKFTLNSVCDAALGVELDSRHDDVEYRASFKMIEESFVKRISNPFYMIGPLFDLFIAPKYERHLKVVHEFSSGIIERRRQLFAKEGKSEKSKTDASSFENEDYAFKKKRYAMLDTLLLAEKEGAIDHIGICEEVDTFMFEGFDTTSMALVFGLMNLSLYPDMQERCYQEIMANIDDDLNQLSISQLNNLKYLECFIKETLRLYPSVPLIMRKAVTETKLANNLILPAETNIPIHIFDIQRNPKYFPDPEKFDPDRFTPENTLGRHPFAFLPFSAGQRNCIGQKFAMLEVKTLIVYILKNFKLLPLMDPKDFIFESGIIIRTKNIVKVKLIKRE